WGTVKAGVKVASPSPPATPAAVATVETESKVEKVEEVKSETTTVGEASVSVTASETGAVPVTSDPTTVQALADYTSTGDGQMTLTSGEELTVIVWEYGNGWAYGQSKDGTRSGVFPQTYVERVA
ncbi:hypothetical protein HK104_002449, partial [Borealophlyctis nickersoniae]